MREMTIKEQVRYLMQGSEYGDPELKDKMATQLNESLLAAKKKTGLYRSIAVLTPEPQICTQATLCPFENCGNFRLLWEKGEAVYLHETFYALMQGYDAYHLKADVQVGGTDQLFNIVTASRKLMTALNTQPNVAIIMGILPGTDGEIKMSKSLGNHIPILASPEDMYGKVMSIPDTAIHSYFVMVTRLLPDEIDRIIEGMNEGRLHPRDVKMRLAREIVTIYHSAAEAERAEGEFVRVFRKSELPEDMSFADRE